VSRPQLQVVDAAYNAALKRFGGENNLRDLMRRGFVPGTHIISKDVQNRHGWSEERCYFHKIVPTCRDSYRFYVRSEIERYSTPEHTRRWLEHYEAAQAEKHRRIVDADNHRVEFETRKANGTLITRQEIIANGWRVPAEPDFVEPLGRGRVRYYYRLPIPVSPVTKRRSKMGGAS
jgi:hypothetical protein